MSGGVFRYYFLLEEDAQQFADQMAAPLQKAGFRTCHSFNDRLRSTPFERGYWQYAAFDTRILTIACSQDDDDWQSAINELAALEQQIPVDLDMILGQTTIIISMGSSWEELLEKCQELSKHRPGMEIAVKNGRLMRYGLSPTQSCYIANLQTFDSASLAFLAQRLAQLEAQHLNLNMIDRLLKDQEYAVSQESAALDRELSLILHANLVSAQGEQREAQELAAQLQGLATSYGKIAGSRHLISKGKARLQTLLNQFTRQVTEETALIPQQKPFAFWIRDYQERLDQLALAELNLHASQQNYQAAIEVVRSRIDMMNSRSNLATQAQIRALMEQNTEMQKQSLVFQYAAGLIEFIILAYYSHSLWKNLAHDAYLLIPTPIQFIVVLLFSGNAVYCTHLLAEYMQGEHEVKQRMIISLLLLTMLLVLIIAGSIIMGVPVAAVPGAAAGH
jgi:hypothetical protein